MTPDLRPNGRWHRILAALNTAPLKRCALFTAVRDPSTPRETDKDRVWKATGALMRAGFIVRVQGELWITDAGRAALAELGPYAPTSVRVLAA